VSLRAMLRMPLIGLLAVMVAFGFVPAAGAVPPPAEPGIEASSIPASPDARAPVIEDGEGLPRGDGDVPRPAFGAEDDEPAKAIAVAPYLSDGGGAERFSVSGVDPRPRAPAFLLPYETGPPVSSLP